MSIACRTSLRLPRIACIGVTLVAVMGGAAQRAAAGPISCRTTGLHAAHFHLLEIGKSFNGAPVKFYNYDFGSPTCARANNVEWPIDLLFWNNASRSAIESGLSSFFPYGGVFASTEYARINDGAGTFWARNGGKKTAIETKGTTDDHYRIYAYSERSYATDFGYFVIGTIHKDNNEFAGYTHAEYGESEKAEKELGADAGSLAVGWEVNFDNYNMENEQYGQEGNHIWENNGNATMIRLE